MHPSDPADLLPEGTPAVVLDWLEHCRVGGVQVVAGRDSHLHPWAEVLRDVRALTRHLVAAGLTPGMRVGVRGDNTYEWVVLDLALIGVGAVPVALPIPDFTGVGNAELARRFGLSMVFATKDAVGPDDDASVARLDELLSLPPVVPDPDPPAPVGKRAPAGTREPFTVVFSSGTAGRLKCLLIAWRGVAKLIEAMGEAYALRPTDRIMIALPLSTFQQRYLTYLAIRNDCSVVLTTPRHMLPSLQRDRPTILLGPPNFYELAENRFRQLARGRRRLLEAAAAPAAVLPTALARRWRRRVFRPYHLLYGGAMRLMLVGSAPIRPGTLSFFRTAGLPLYQIYGMTETGFLTWNRPGANRIGTVGRAVYPGTVFLGDDGEVLIRHPWHICIGYEGESPEDAAAVLGPDDTVATGDLGELDPDRYLTIRGRKKNVLVTTGGHKIQLEELEAELCRATRVTRAAVFEPADATGLAAALWYDGDADAVRAVVREQVRQVNARLAISLRIDRVALIEGVPAVDGPLFNRNLKLNRDAVRRTVADQLVPIDHLGTG